MATRKREIAIGAIAVEEVEKLLVMDTLLIAKNARVLTQKNLGSCHGHMVKNVRKVVGANFRHAIG